MRQVRHVVCRRCEQCIVLVHMNHLKENKFFCEKNFPGFFSDTERRTFNHVSELFRRKFKNSNLPVHKNVFSQKVFFLRKKFFLIGCGIFFVLTFSGIEQKVSDFLLEWFSSGLAKRFYISIGNIWKKLRSQKHRTFNIFAFFPSKCECLSGGFVNSASYVSKEHFTFWGKIFFFDQKFFHWTFYDFEGRTCGHLSEFFRQNFKNYVSFRMFLVKTFFEKELRSVSDLFQPEVEFFQWGCQSRIVCVNGSFLRDVYFPKEVCFFNCFWQWKKNFRQLSKNFCAGMYKLNFASAWDHSEENESFMKKGQYFFIIHFRTMLEKFRAFVCVFSKILRKTL